MTNPSRSSPASSPNSPDEDGEHGTPRSRRGCGSPAASGRIAAAIIGASDESGPRTRMRLGPNDRVGEERDDRGVEAVDRRQAGGLGIRHPDRDEHRGQDQPRREVPQQPLRTVVAQGVEAGQPAPDPPLVGRAADAQQWSWFRPGRSACAIYLVTAIDLRKSDRL